MSEEPILLYTIGCPQCLVLEKKLDKAGIDYVKITDQDYMIEKGIRSAPMLGVEGRLLTFSEAITWLKTR